jgi:hypothetical protein
LIARNSLRTSWSRDFIAAISSRPRGDRRFQMTWGGWSSTDISLMPLPIRRASHVINCGLRCSFRKTEAVFRSEIRVWSQRGVPYIEKMTALRQKGGGRSADSGSVQHGPCRFHQGTGHHRPTLLGHTPHTPPGPREHRQRHTPPHTQAGTQVAGRSQFSPYEMNAGDAVLRQLRRDPKPRPISHRYWV